MAPGARGDERGRSEPTDGKNSKPLQIRVSWAFSDVLVLGGERGHGRGGGAQSPSSSLGHQRSRSRCSHAEKQL